MRAIRQVMSSKPRNSSFFDRFIKKYGDRGTTLAVDDEIYKNIKSFYNDLMNGYIQQEKYESYLRNDPRLLRIAIQDSDNRLKKEYVILSCLQFSSANRCAATASPHYKIAYDTTFARYRAYSIINSGLTQFYNTGAMNYLVAISVQIQDPMNRMLKPEL